MFKALLNQFYHCSLCCIMPVLRENMEVFKSYTQLLKLHILYFRACACLCILLLRKHHTNYLSFLLHSLIHTNFTNMFYLHLTDGSGRTDRERNYGCLILLFTSDSTYSNK